MSAECCDDAGSIKRAVRELYAKVAAGEVSCCGEADAEMPMGMENVAKASAMRKRLWDELPQDVSERERGLREPDPRRRAPKGARLCWTWVRARVSTVFSPQRRWGRRGASSAST